MNIDVQRRLNLYGDYNETFWERYCPEKNQNRRPASAPQFEGYKFDILGSNPLNGAVATDPSVVKHELDQVLNRDADTIALGNMPGSIPQVGRDYKNQTISLPQNIPEPVVKETNADLLRRAQNLQTWRTKQGRKKMEPDVTPGEYDFETVG
jgi:hypothetical protein